jgi:hypothetical protein
MPGVIPLRMATATQRCCHLSRRVDSLPRRPGRPRKIPLPGR